MPLQKINKAIAIVALFLIPIFPLIVSNSLFFPFITGKAFYFRLLVEIAFACWAIIAFIDSKYRPRLTPITIGVTVFAVVALIADLLGVNPMRSLWSNFERMEGWITIIHLWALYMVMTNIFGTGEEAKRMWHRLFNASIFCALIVAFYGLFQLFGWAEIHQGSSRLDASLGNSAYLAVYMMLHAFMAAYLFFVAKAKKISNHEFLRYAYPVIALLFGFIVFETQTRGTILGLLGGIMLALFLYAISAGKESKKPRLISAGILVGIILIGVVFWLNRSAPVIQKSAIFSRLANISWSEAQGQARNYIWPMAVKGVMERPIFGWGQENFNYIFNANYNPAMYAQEQWFDRAHSVFLDWLVAAGFVGLLAYLALYVLILVEIWRSTLTVAEKSVFTGLLAGYFIHNIFVFDNLASYYIFFVILGFADSHSRSKATSLFGTKHLSRDAAEYVVLPIVLVVLAVVVYSFQYRLFQANNRLISALVGCSGNSQPDTALYEKALDVNVYAANQEIREQLLSCAGRVVASQQMAGPTRQAFYTAAVEEANAQIKYTPKDTRIYTLAGSLFNSIGQYSVAETYLEKAHELSPMKQSIVFELATDYLNDTGKTDKALLILEQAYKSAPAYFQAKVAFATAMVIAGKETEARVRFNNDQAVFNTVSMARAFTARKEYSKAIGIYKALIKATPTDTDMKAQLAQTQYTAGLINDAIVTLRDIAKDKPELKDQIEVTVARLLLEAKK